MTTETYYYENFHIVQVDVKEVEVKRLECL
jgi:hypothetical protein